VSAECLQCWGWYRDMYQSLSFHETYNQEKLVKTNLKCRTGINAEGSYRVLQTSKKEETTSGDVRQSSICRIFNTVSKH
jgi:hypothetical protein